MTAATSDLATAGRPAESDGPPAPGQFRRVGLLARSPAWPITALLVGYPIWWALGLADFTWIFLAIPMVVRMVAWRTKGGRKIRVPPGFGLWLLFLLIAALGIVTLTLTAPGTVPSPVSHRVISYANRLANYGGVTVMLLFAGNLTERELPRRKFAWMLGLVGLFAVFGGFAGMAMPHFAFKSPLLLLLPKSVQANPFIQASMHPGFSQVQNVLGTAGGRPKAPFDYTNIWGDCLTILLPYLIVGWWQGGSRRQRMIAAGAIVLSVMPLLYSLNRGAWIGAGLSVLYLAVRFAARGKRALLGALVAIVAITGVLVLVTPLQSVVVSRLHHGKSNNLRSNLDSLAVTDGLASPVIGYGDTRQERGSPNSIAIGPSYKCPICGQLAVGSTGQLWLLLVCDGVLGAGLYLGFFAFGAWRFRHDNTPYGLAGELVLLLSFVYMFAYDAVGAPLGMTMLAYGLMWKSGMDPGPELDPPS
ncbi:MAG: O-antigen ligase family protein [Streptosporangiaceae bacterium]